MIRTLTSRRVSSALNGAAAGSLVRKASNMTVRAMAGSFEASITRRSYHNQKHHSGRHQEERSSRVRSSSPSPASRSPLSYQVMSPKSTQRSYNTSSPILVEAIAAPTPQECPIRHLQDSFYEPQHLALIDPYYAENELMGYVATSKGAVETTFRSTIHSDTTDGDMDMVADDEEWLPNMQAPAAEQVLAMMDTSYYHATYRAKSRVDEEENGQQ